MYHISSIVLKALTMLPLICSVVLLHGNICMGNKLFFPIAMYSASVSSGDSIQPNITMELNIMILNIPVL